MTIGALFQPFFYVADAIKNPAPPQPDPVRPIAGRAPALSCPGRDEISLMEPLLRDVLIGPLIAGARHAVLLIAVMRIGQPQV
jgi:hypothetical protein